MSARQSQLVAAAIADGEVSLALTTGARSAVGTAPESLDRVDTGAVVRSDGAVTMEPTVALVFSPEQWVEELHRHLAHHGGARVRQIVVDPAVALDEEYDILVVSDRWPALTRGFVGAVHDRGRCVLGVFDPDEPAGKDHLVALGVDATIAADAAMAEFVVCTARARPRDVRGPPTIHRSVVDDTGGPEPGSLVVVSGPRGGGITEVALGLAAALGHRRAPVVLVDAHDTAPAVAGQARSGARAEPAQRGRSVRARPGRAR